MKKLFLFFVLGLAAFTVSCKDPKQGETTQETELRLSTNEFDNVPFEGITLGLTITTEADWEITEIPEWITIATPTGSGTTKIDIEVAANDGEERQAVLKVAAEELEETLTINQDAVVNEPMLKVPNAEFNGLRKDGEAITLSIVSAVIEWSIADLPEWCSVAAEDMSGTGNKSIRINVAGNSGDNTRQGAFRVVGEGVPNVNVSLSQLGTKMYMPDPTLRANEAYNGRIVVVNETTGEFTLTDRGRTDTSVSSYCGTTLAGLEHYPNLRSLNITGDAVQDRNLSEIDIRAFRTLQVLTLDACPKVKVVRANNMPEIGLIDIRNSGNRDRVAIEEIYVQGSLKLDSLACANGKLTKVDVSGASRLRTLVLFGNASLAEVEGLEDCSRLEELRLYSCNFTSLDVSASPNLATLQCRNNKLTSLDLSKNSKISYLSCGTNAIPELNIGHLTDLETLLCENTTITSLDLSACPKLRYLECQNNAIENLDLSGKSNLSYLDCFGMPKLQTLNVSGCSNLTMIGLTHNAANAPVTHNSYSGASTAILDLSPYLDVTPSFKEFIVDNNATIKGIRCEANAKVERVSVQNCSRLSSVVFKDNGNLRYLNVTGNNITMYDVRGNHPDIEVVGRE